MIFVFDTVYSFKGYFKTLKDVKEKYKGTVLYKDKDAALYNTE